MKQMRKLSWRQPGFAGSIGALFVVGCGLANRLFPALAALPANRMPFIQKD